MSLVYRVITCNALPARKESFKCRCEALKFIKSQLESAPKDADKADVLCSIRMYRIDEELIEGHEKIFA